MERQFKEAAAFKLKGRLRGRVGRQDQLGPGAARNLASTMVAPATEFLLFMDDDNIAKPHEVATLVQARSPSRYGYARPCGEGASAARVRGGQVAHHTGADVVTVCNDYFTGDEPPAAGATPTGRWVPLGSAPAVGMFTNAYGDTNSLFRLSAFRALVRRTAAAAARSEAR